MDVTETHCFMGFLFRTTKMAPEWLTTLYVLLQPVKAHFTFLLNLIASFPPDYQCTGNIFSF